MSATLQEHSLQGIIHPKEYFVSFIGDYAQLTELEYSFQKLYAANYQQWNKGDIRAWKKGKIVTHDQLGNRFPAVLNALLRIGFDSLPFEQSSLFPDTYWMRLYIHNETYECTPDPSKYKQARKRFWESWDKRKEEDAQGIEPTAKLNVEDWTELAFTPEDINPLRELVEKGWIKLEKRAA